MTLWKYGTPYLLVDALFSQQQHGVCLQAIVIRKSSYQECMKSFELTRMQLLVLLIIQIVVLTTTNQHEWRSSPASMKVFPASSLWQALTTTTLVLDEVWLASSKDLRLFTSIAYISAYFVSKEIALLSPWPVGCKRESQGSRCYVQVNRMNALLLVWIHLVRQ